MLYAQNFHHDKLFRSNLQTIERIFLLVSFLSSPSSCSTALMRHDTTVARCVAAVIRFVAILCCGGWIVVTKSFAIVVRLAATSVKLAAAAYKFVATLSNAFAFITSVKHFLASPSLGTSLSILIMHSTDGKF